MYVQQLDENQTLSNAQRKQMLEERKRELQQQQKVHETEHLQILKTIAEHDMVDFRQTLLQEKHAHQKAFLQEVGKEETLLHLLYS